MSIHRLLVESVDRCRGGGSDEGRDAVARFCARIFGSGRRFNLVPTRANCQPAFAAYLRAPDGIGHGVGLLVLTLSCDGICAMTRFENTVLPWCG